MGSPLDYQPGGSHYKDQAIQPIEFILANKIGFCEGNVIKYVCRWREKNGIEDLRKAIHYIEFLINECEESKHDRTVKPERVGSDRPSGTRYGINTGGACGDYRVIPKDASEPRSEYIIFDSTDTTRV